MFRSLGLLHLVDGGNLALLRISKVFTWVQGIWSGERFHPSIVLCHYGLLDL